jgi:hypothetical protein
MVLLELLTGKRPSQKLTYKVEKHVPGPLSTTMAPPFSAVLDKRVKKWNLPNGHSAGSISAVKTNMPVVVSEPWGYAASSLVGGEDVIEAIQCMSADPLPFAAGEWQADEDQQPVPEVRNQLSAIHMVSGLDSSDSNGTLEMAMIALEMLNDEDDERLSVVDALPRLEALLDTQDFNVAGSSGKAKGGSKGGSKRGSKGGSNGKSEASTSTAPNSAAQPRPFSYESVRTLRPKKHHTHGTKRWTMHARIKDTLSSGSTDIREVVKLPQDASENE